METIILSSLALLALALLAAILSSQNKILRELKNIRIPEPPPPPKIEFPKIEIPPVEIPPAKEVVLDLQPVIEAINNIRIPEPPPPPPPSSAKELDVDVLQEISTLMRVNQAEFQSGLEAFHKAIEKLLSRIPDGERELNTQKEFMQKFEEAMNRAQESAAEAMNENSLRLQEILTEVLSKEAK